MGRKRGFTPRPSYFHGPGKDVSWGERADYLDTLKYRRAKKDLPESGIPGVSKPPKFLGW